MKAKFLMPVPHVFAAIAATIFSSLSMIPEASAQLPEEEGNSRPHIFLSAIGSFPMNDFGSQDPFLENAGFAQSGYGIGFSSCLYTGGTNTFFHIGINYLVRRSAIWENTLPFVQESLGSTFRGEVLNEINYRHLPVIFGAGQKFDLGRGGGCVILKGTFGVVYNGLSSSSVRVGDQRAEINFRRSGSLSTCLGGGVSILSGDGVGLEVEYLQMIGNVEFGLVESRSGSTETVEIPVSMLNVKLLIALVKP